MRKDGLWFLALGLCLVFEDQRPKT